MSKKDELTKEQELLAMNLYSVLVGHDYMTGSSLKRVEEFHPDTYKAARELLEQHPEIKALAGYYQRECNRQRKIVQDKLNHINSKYNELRNSYNDLCEKYGEDDYVGENFYAQQ